MNYESTSNRIRADSAEACLIADLATARMAELRKLHKDSVDDEGYLLGWDVPGHRITWTPYLECDFLGITADKTGVHYDPATDTEMRSINVDPMTDVPDNAHWKGWVW
jgi:hypothetical protein